MFGNQRLQKSNQLSGSHNGVRHLNLRMKQEAEEEESIRQTHDVQPSSDSLQMFGGGSQPGARGGADMAAAAASARANMQF